MLTRFRTSFPALERPFPVLKHPFSFLERPFHVLERLKMLKLLKKSGRVRCVRACDPKNGRNSHLGD